jgi:tetraacyldisaccharide 4'-kinase
MLSHIFLPLSYIYSLGSRLRVSLYRNNILKTHSLPVPCISVGNITLGGTGKTPFTQWLAYLIKKKIAILKRSYGDEDRIYEDEGLRIFTGRNRVTLAKKAVDEGFEVILLDDGFQYLNLKRNLDIVLINGLNPFGNGFLFPAGTLREPLSALTRGDIFCITRIDQCQNIEVIYNVIHRFAPQKPIIEAVHKPESLFSKENREVDMQFLRGREVLALCAIGSPISFELTLESLGAKVERVIRFLDHHSYTHRDIKTIERLSEKLPVITTEKDWAKIRKFKLNFPVYILKIHIEIKKGEEVLRNEIQRCGC